MNWKKGLKKRRLIPDVNLLICSISLGFCIIYSSFVSAQTASFSIHFINVGYGDAILLQFPDGKNFLIDAGEDEYSKTLLDYLKKRNVAHIHSAIMTHPHKNHFQGFIRIFDEMPVDQMYVNGDERAEERYDELITMLAQKMVKVNLLKQGDQLREGAIRILHPETVDVSVNDSSLVTLVTFQKIRILLLADVGPKELDKILAANPQLKDVDVIQIPHHGKTITKEFMKTFRNKVFIASTGANPWGEIDEAKIRSLQGDVYRTDRHGTIIIQSDGQQIQVRHE